jgi:hypothetical protein
MVQAVTRPVLFIHTWIEGKRRTIKGGFTQKPAAQGYEPKWTVACHAWEGVGDVLLSQAPGRAKHVGLEGDPIEHYRDAMDGADLHCDIAPCKLFL